MSSMIDLSQHELHRYAEIVEPDASIIGRNDVAEQAIAALGRRAVRPALIVGPPGSGRTAALSAIRTRLDAGGAEAVSRSSVLRIDGGRLAGVGATAFRGARDVAGPSELIAIDDLDLLLGLGANSFDMELAAIVRAMAQDPGLRIVATINSAYVATLEAREPGLTAAFEAIELPPLDDETLCAIAHAQADQLEAHHGVALAGTTAELAAGPPPPGSQLAHPGLLIVRLDAACVHARLRGSAMVEPGDIDAHHADPSPEVVDPQQLGAALRERVAGQDAAIEAITNRLALTSRQLDLSAHRPDGVFLFVGPTGVGKTELALALAEARFGDESKLIRLDMSEYGEEHTTSRMIGSPPGYKGSDEPDGWFTTRIREAPRSVVLLDEIEKADPAVWMLLLQMFDAGRLTDGRGEVASFADAVVIMTSNLGTGHHAKGPIGFAAGEEATAEASRERIMDAVRAAMPPELVNRIDQVVVFEPLSRSAIEEIAASMINGAAATVRERGWQLQIDPEVVAHVAGLGYDQAYGARHLKRAVETHLLGSLATRPPGAYRAELADGNIVWEPDEAAAAAGGPNQVHVGPADPTLALADAKPVRLRASLSLATRESAARTVVVTAGGADRIAVARLIVDSVAEELEVDEAAELITDPIERPVAITGLSRTAAHDLRRRLRAAGADTTEDPADAP